MHGATHQAGLVISLHGGGSHNADSRHARQGQGPYTVRRHQGRLTDSVQPRARPAELQMSRADT